MSLVKQKRDTERIMSMVEDAQRAREYENEISLIKDILEKLIVRIDAALDGKKIVSNRNNPISDKDYWAIIEDYNKGKGLNTVELGEKYGRHLTTVRSLLMREGVYVPQKTGRKRVKKRR